MLGENAIRWQLGSCLRLTEIIGPSSSELLALTAGVPLIFSWSSLEMVVIEPSAYKPDVLQSLPITAAVQVSHL